MINLNMLTEEKQTALLERIDALSAEIESFQSSGGDIYDERRKLPYYERVRSIVRS